MEAPCSIDLIGRCPEGKDTQFFRDEHKEITSKYTIEDVFSNDLFILQRASAKKQLMPNSLELQRLNFCSIIGTASRCSMRAALQTFAYDGLCLRIVPYFDKHMERFQERYTRYSVTRTLTYRPSFIQSKSATRICYRFDLLLTFFSRILEC